jgi:diphthamide biosynthesis enzyme Dph1/Dph2-like protein
MTDYDLELERVAAEIIKCKAKKVLIQLADGLKPYAKHIQQSLQKNLSKKRDDVEIFFYLNSCYGKCDIPTVKGIDIIVQFGH